MPAASAAAIIFIHLHIVSLSVPKMLRVPAFPKFVQCSFILPVFLLLCPFVHVYSLMPRSLLGRPFSFSLAPWILSILCFGQHQKKGSQPSAGQQWAHTQELTGVHASHLNLLLLLGGKNCVAGSAANIFAMSCLLLRMAIN